MVSKDECAALEYETLVVGGQLRNEIQNTKRELQDALNQNQTSPHDSIANSPQVICVGPGC
jgi:hypothetical protein